MGALQEAQAKAGGQAERHAQPLHSCSPPYGRNSGDDEEERDFANGPDHSDVRSQGDRSEPKTGANAQQKVTGTQKSKARRAGSASLKPMHTHARAKSNVKVPSKGARKLSVRRVDSSNTSSESSLSPLQRCRRISLGTQVQAQAAGFDFPNRSSPGSS